MSRITVLVILFFSFIANSKQEYSQITGEFKERMIRDIGEKSDERIEKYVEDAEEEDIDKYVSEELDDFYSFVSSSCKVNFPPQLKEIIEKIHQESYKFRDSLDSFASSLATTGMAESAKNVGNQSLYLRNYVNSQKAKKYGKSKKELSDLKREFTVKIHQIVKERYPESLSKYDDKIEKALKRKTGWYTDFPESGWFYNNKQKLLEGGRLLKVFLKGKVDGNKHLHQMAREGHTVVVKLILAKYPSINEATKALASSIRIKNRVKVSKMLISYLGVDNIKKNLSRKNWKNLKDYARRHKLNLT